jgi:hypothetical protein
MCLGENKKKPILLKIERSAARIQSKNGALELILLSMMMLLVGGGLIPQVLGVVGGIISA